MPMDYRANAFGATLQHALQLMTAEQLSELQEEVSKTLTASEEVQSRSGGEFADGVVNSYKIAYFRVTQEAELKRGDQVRAKQLRFVCVECRAIPFEPVDTDSVCIMCGSIGMIEVDRIEPPEE